MKKEYHIPVTWRMEGIITVWAENIQEAKELAVEEYLEDGEVIEGSVRVKHHEIEDLY
jgi:predicted RNase H-like HicB family nuclease